MNYDRDQEIIIIHDYSGCARIHSGSLTLERGTPASKGGSSDVEQDVRSRVQLTRFGPPEKTKSARWGSEARRVKERGGRRRSKKFAKKTKSKRKIKKRKKTRPTP